MKINLCSMEFRSTKNFCLDLCKIGIGSFSGSLLFIKYDSNHIEFDFCFFLTYVSNRLIERDFNL
jgi:hypothetical protein